MKIREIESFDAFMTYGSVTRAAEAMNISQPMVSRLLSKFEQSVGFALFQRTGNQLTPTREAEQFQATIARSLISLNELKTQARAIANQQTGAIRITAQPSHADTYLLNAVAAFKRSHPNVLITINDLGLEGVLETVSSGNSDLGIGITLNLKHPMLEMTKLATCQAICVLPREHKLAGFETIDIDLLHDESFIDLALGSPLRTRIDYIFQVAGWSRKTSAEARTVRVVTKLVEQNVGIAVLDPFAQFMIDPQKAIALPLTPKIEWDVTLFHTKRPLTQIENQFIHHIQTELATQKGKMGFL
ncbi:LysR family transcriptional regulator [Terasakiella pusilla]|uniref:LysR family transcriptional regulator n=1 Tax=Terasakiella pusilla TaxID=64973 RepID=UPI0004920562|nr:LysR family transcriptional regulator [Terasakiella pusilla]